MTPTEVLNLLKARDAEREANLARVRNAPLLNPSIHNRSTVDRNADSLTPEQIAKLTKLARDIADGWLETKEAVARVQRARRDGTVYGDAYGR